MLSFGEKIKLARKSKKLTQKQLAEKIGAAHNSISDWENNTNKPDPNTIELLCGVLEITPNYLLAVSSEDFTPAEKLLIKQYRELDTHGKEMVDFTLNKEHERSIKDNCKTIEATIYNFKNNDATFVAEDSCPYGVNAAHERTDISYTDEERQADEDMLD